MSDRTALAAYALTVVLLTSVHHPAWMLAALGVVLAIAGRGALLLAAKALRATIFFTGLVSLGYALLALGQDSFSLRYLVLLNLRVLALTSLTLLLVQRVNLYRALGFSRTLVFLLVLATSQAMTFRRVFLDFRMALASRTLGPLRGRDLYRHRAATVRYFLDKAEHEATEISQAMRSRGFFLD